ncbi:MAG: TonB-dependent receptor [Thermodesulforhabdaceae bacterium]
MILVLMFFLLFPICPIYAEPEPQKTDDIQLEEIIVKEKKIIKEKSSISIANESIPANVNVVTKDELSNIVTSKHEEIFRKIPGLYVESYGQGDIGSALTMRGLGGGGGGKRYIATYIDGVPQNYPIYFGDHLISWLMPEMIERIDVIKGPFSVLCGDNSVGGCINITTPTTSPSSVVTSGGSYGSFRVLPTFSYDKLKFTPLVLGEYHRTDGFRDNSDYERYNFFTKVSYPIGDSSIALRFNYYKADWDAPGYISKTELEKDIVSRKSTLTPDDGGDSEAVFFVVNYTPDSKEEGLYITTYYSDVELNRYVAFPIYSTSPIAQQARIFNTDTAGIKTYYNFFVAKEIMLTPGFEFRYDDGYYQRYPTQKRTKSGECAQYWDARYTQYSMFVQGQIKPVEFLKFVGGIRYDGFAYDITNHVVPDNSGEGDSYVLSPKVGIVISPFRNFDIFANWSKGARAPYINELSPSSSSQRKNFDLEPAYISSWDTGFSSFLFDRLKFSVDYYQTDLKREVAIINNEPVNIGDSSRKGVEIDLKFYILPEFAVYSSYSWVNAEVKNPINPGQDKVIDVPEDIIKLGFEFIKSFSEDEKFYGDLGYYYTSGKYYYIGKSTSPVKGPVFDKYTLNLNYKMKKLGYFLSATYTPRKYSSEVTWLNGNEIMLNPQPLWNFTVGLKYEF